MLVDVSGVDTSTNVFGRSISFPLSVSPAGLLVSFSDPSFPFSSCFGGRRPFPSPETCLMTPEPSLKEEN